MTDSDQPTDNSLLSVFSEVSLNRSSVDSRRRLAREALPDVVLERIRHHSGRLATEAVKSMGERLDYFAELSARDRASIQLVVQSTVVDFVDYIDSPDSEIRFSLTAFEGAERAIGRRVTLKQSVEMIQVALEFFERWAPALGRTELQQSALTESVLRFGRAVGFQAAALYATAAEARGAWDSRMEALLVDGIVRGDSETALLSRAATLNWDPHARATAVVGGPPPGRNLAVADALHTIGSKYRRPVLSAIHGNRLVVVISGEFAHSPFETALVEQFSSGAIVIGPSVDSLESAHSSVSEAIAAVDVVAGWRSAPRPVRSWELLPERALNGERAASQALLRQVVGPINAAGSAIAHTLDSYLDSGGSVEASARELFVHPNTVRYRLRRISEITGLDPLSPRDAYVLQIATTIGRFSQTS